IESRRLTLQTRPGRRPVVEGGGANVPLAGGESLYAGVTDPGKLGQLLPSVGRRLKGCPYTVFVVHRTQHADAGVFAVVMMRCVQGVKASALPVTRCPRHFLTVQR